MEMKERSLYCTDGGITEACHSRLRQTEEKFGTKTVHSLGQGNHAQRLKNSIVFHNCSQYGDIQLVKALDFSSSSPKPLDTPAPEPVVEVVTAETGHGKEDIVTLQTELAASRNRILVKQMRK